MTGPPYPYAGQPPGDQDWMTDGACVDLPTDVMFPDGDDDAHPDDINHARRICANCPVREPCYLWALNNPKWTQYGIWAGTTGRERRTIRERRRRQRVSEQARRAAQQRRLDI